MKTLAEKTFVGYNFHYQRKSSSLFVNISARKYLFDFTSNF